MKKIKPLDYTQLSSRCDPKQFKFATTRELPLLKEPVGQERAIAAIEFGISMSKKGYNLFLLGREGTGRHTLIQSLLKKQARRQPTPDDWCYIYNFVSPLQPIAISFPPGLGLVFQTDMNLFIDELKENLKNTLQPLDLKKLSKNLFKKYKKYPIIQKHLQAIEIDIVKNLYKLSSLNEKTLPENFFDNYVVNVLVSHKKNAGAPIVYEDFPSQGNLVGKIEYMRKSASAHFSHFSLIKAGSLHKANGGYLILDVNKVLSQPPAWDVLKRDLLTQSIHMELLGQFFGAPNSMLLEPMPIPLNVKVILIGDRNLYYLLCEHDNNFNDLFKVAADFNNHIRRNKRNYSLYSRLIATITDQKNLHPLDRSAVARLIDHSSRLAHDTKRLTTHMRELTNLLEESHYWSQKANRTVIKDGDVQQAIDQKIYRANRVETRIHEDLHRNILLINTRGKKIGQINGLSVMQLGHYQFSIPSRITATVHLGKGELIDIEREVELGGAIHSKGVLILSGFLTSRYLPDKHLSIAASLVFEQNYGEVEGDSASAAELAALLSAIAKLPIDQSFAITGSVNQYGEVQAIGNINEKVEGFFAACKIKRLTKKQGVIIPAANTQHLMLKEEVVRAAKKKEFFIYAVENIDQIMEILTKMPAGKATRKGRFPKNTFNGRIEQSLLKFLENAEEEHKQSSEPGESLV